MAFVQPGSLSRSALNIPPRVLVALLVTLSALMVGMAVVEYQESRRDLQSLMEVQAHTLLEGVLAASDNALNATDELTARFQERLIDNASFVRQVQAAGNLSAAALSRLVTSNALAFVSVVGREGTVLSSGISSPATVSAYGEYIEPILSGRAESVPIGFHMDSGGRPRYALAVAGEGRSAIIVGLDAAPLLDFQRSVGFGSLLRRVAGHPGIVYLALQDSAQVIAGDGRTDLLEPISGSPFLAEAWGDTSFAPLRRTIVRDSERVLEVVLPFFYQDAPVGLFRMGVSLAPLDAIGRRALRRLLLTGLVILIVGFAVVTLIVARQNMDLLQRQYRAVETYSGRVLQHVSDGIIVYHPEKGIRTLNEAAEALFQVSASSVLGRPIQTLLTGEECDQFLSSPALMARMDCTLADRTVHLLVARSRFEDEHGETNILLVARDLTRLRRLEAQLQQRERYSMMGEVAGGLAHEIRNPLNAVSTIVQQLRTDFHTTEHQQEYDELLEIVYREVRRISDSVQSFLQTVRPAPLHPEWFPVAELLRTIEHEFLGEARERNVVFRVVPGSAGDVYWDRNQMHQVLMNLVRNALEAVDTGGSVEIDSTRTEDEGVEIRVSDDGEGIPPEVRPRLFDLYFTTKPGGTGIGLSLVQRIVSDHGGTVEIEDRPGGGAAFCIRMPVWARTRNRPPQA